jgi:cephalosporin hydroxylase
MENLMIPESIETLDELLEYYDSKYSVSTKWYQDVLIKYATGMDSVVEFGTWNGQGVAVFAKAGVPNIISCDIDFSRVNQNKIKELCSESDIQFVKENSLSPTQELTADFIFFDTMHTYEHVLQELRTRANGAKKYFAVHDTNYPPPRKNPKDGKLVRNAVLQYLEENPDFVLELEYPISTGIMIVRRK